MGAVDARKVRAGRQHFFGPARGGIGCVWSRHHDVHLATGRSRPEQSLGVLVQERVGLCPVERIGGDRGVTRLAGEPAAKAEQRIPDVPLASPQRGQPQPCQLKLERTNIRLA